MDNQIITSPEEKIWNPNAIKVIPTTNAVRDKNFLKNPRDFSNIDSSILIMDKEHFLNIIYTFILERPCISC